VNVVRHDDLVGLYVEELNDVSGKRTLAVGVKIELVSFFHVKGDERIGQEIIGFQHGRTVGVMQKGFECSVREADVLVAHVLLAREEIEVFCKSALVVASGVASDTADFGAGTVLVCRGDPAVVKCERQHVSGVVVQLCRCQRAGVEQKISGRIAVFGAVCDELADSTTVDHVAVSLGIVMDEEHLHTAMVACQFLLPDLVIGTVQACIIGFGTIVHHAGEVIEISLEKRFVMASFDVFGDDFFEASGSIGQSFALFQSVVNSKKVLENNVDTVNIQNQMADLEEDHALIVVGFDKVRLNDLSAQISDGTLSDLQNKVVLFLLRVEFQNGDLFDRLSIAEILHQLAALFEKSDAQAVITLNEQIECSGHHIYVNFFGNGDGGQYIDDSLEECVFALQIHNVLRRTQLITNPVFFHFF